MRAVEQRPLGDREPVPGGAERQHQTRGSRGGGGRVSDRGGPDSRPTRGRHRFRAATVWCRPIVDEALRDPATGVPAFVMQERAGQGRLLRGGASRQRVLRKQRRRLPETIRAAVATRVLWLTYPARNQPDEPATGILTYTGQSSSGPPDVQVITRGWVRVEAGAALLATQRFGPQSRRRAFLACRSPRASSKVVTNCQPPPNFTIFG